MLKKLTHTLTRSLLASNTLSKCISNRYIIEKTLILTQYRKQIIENNLTKAGFCIPISQVYRSMARSFAQVTNPSIYSSVNVQDCLQKIDINDGINIILMGHIGNWESIGRKLAKNTMKDTYAVYHPLSNKPLNEWINNHRSIHKLKTIPSKHFIKHLILSHKASTSLNYIILADQRPYELANVHTIDFLGNPIRVNTYLDRLQQKYPIKFFYIRQGNDNSASIIELTIDGTSVTNRFYRLLEQDILSTPDEYLWSHRRWKTM